jgi:hypothetical protein
MDKILQEFLEIDVPESMCDETKVFVYNWIKSKIQTHNIDPTSLEVSAVFWPKRKEVEATWECLETHKKISIVFPVTEEQGNSLAEIVMPCVYQKAKPIGGENV